MSEGVPETERKYTASHDAAQLDASALGASEPARRFTLTAEYFDTPAYDLTRAGWSLRRRTGGDDAGWHLKAPRVGDAREEIGLPLTDGGVPRAFRDRIADVVGARPLARVATLVTDRTQWELSRADGTPRAHVVSDVVSVDGEHWREVEVELVPGEPLASLDAFEAALGASGYRPAEHGSKIAKALGEHVARGEREVGAHSAAGDVILAYAAKQVGTWQSLESAVLADAPDAVHKSRVAARRLRSVLRTYRPLFEADRVDALVPELKWCGEVLGEPRDAEVLKEHLLAALEELPPGHVAGPVTERLNADLDALHQHACDRLAAVMEGPRNGALQRSLMDLLADRPLSGKGKRACAHVVPDLVAKAVKQTRRRFEHASETSGDLTPWHETRKSAKAVRYCCEALEPVYGRDADAAAELWEEVTERLGEVQDTVVAIETLDQLAAEASGRGEPVETYRELQGRQLEKRSASLSAGRKAVEDALAAGLDWL